MMMLWSAKALLVTSILAVGSANQTDDYWSCETQSLHWDKQAHQNLSSQCGDLRMSYDKQYCVVENITSLRCMVERASMHDYNSCSCHKTPDGSRIPIPWLCYYLEICAFVDAGFQCGNNYSCSVDDNNGHMECTASGHRPYMNNCTKGIIHCPDANCTFDLLEYLVAETYKFFEGHCRSKYQEVFGEEQIVYYIDRGHFNRTDYKYGLVRAILPPGYNESDPCELKPSELKSTFNQWLLLCTVSASVILIITVPVCSWRIHIKKSKNDKRWTDIFNQTLEFVTRFMQSEPNSDESTVEVETREHADLITADVDSQDGLLQDDSFGNDTRHVEDNHVAENQDEPIRNSTESRENEESAQSSCLSVDKDQQLSTETQLVLDFESCESGGVARQDHNDSPMVTVCFDESRTPVPHCTMNVYENTTYGQSSFDSGYLPKSFDCDQETS